MLFLIWFLAEMPLRVANRAQSGCAAAARARIFQPFHFVETTDPYVLESVNQTCGCHPFWGNTNTVNKDLELMLSRIHNFNRDTFNSMEYDKQSRELRASSQSMI